MLWLGTHFPSLPLEVFALRDASHWKMASRWERSPHRDDFSRDRDGEIAPTDDIQDIPRVVVEDNRVFRCNAAAATAGIVAGSSLATAHSIAPGLVHYRRSHGQEAARLRRLAETLYRFSPQVSLVPPDGVVLEIGASLKLFGGVASLTAEAAALCRALDHETICRTAETPLAALTLARTAAPTLAAASLRLAAVEPEHLSPAVIEQLGNMGVHTLGQLLALPPAGVAARFGQGLADYLQRLTGDQPDPRRHLQPSTRFRRHLHLLSAIRDKEILLAPMTQLLTELQHWLVAHQLGVEQLLWQFSAAGRGARPVSLRVQFATGQQRLAQLFEVSRLQLERTALPEEVIGLGLSAERLRPWQTGSQALFHYLAPGAPARTAPAGNRSGNRSGKASRPPADDRNRASRNTGGSARLSAGEIAELGELIDRLEARLGQGVCWSLRARDQHLPEEAWQRVTPIRAGAVLPAGRVPDGGGQGRTTRPVWLFVPPRTIRPEQLTLLRGPERIESGWWRIEQRSPRAEEVDGGTVSRPRSAVNSIAIGRSLPPVEGDSIAIGRSLPPAEEKLRSQAEGNSPPSASEGTATWRDYYVARHANGAECWVFRDAGSRWYLHGYFG